MYNPMNTVCFGRDDLELFSRASHDNSPLHMSEDYARHTSYGETIVFGILEAFAALGSLPDRPGQELASASLNYNLPVLLGVDYEIEPGRCSPDRAKVNLLNSGRIMMSAVFRFREGGDDGRQLAAAGIAPVHTQADWRPDALQAGVMVSGTYAPEPDPFRDLIERWRLAGKGVTVPQIATFLWSSYLTGMQLPGLLGTSAMLRLTFRGEEATAEVPFDYSTRVVEFDDRYSRLHSATVLGCSQGPFADAEVWSHIRVESNQPALRARVA
jgi:MaoC like domain